MKTGAESEAPAESSEAVDKRENETDRKKKTSDSRPRFRGEIQYEQLEQQRAAAESAPGSTVRILRTGGRSTAAEREDYRRCSQGTGDRRSRGSQSAGGSLRKNSSFPKQGRGKSAVRESRRQCCFRKTGGSGRATQISSRRRTAGIWQKQSPRSGCPPEETTAEKGISGGRIFGSCPGCGRRRIWADSLEGRQQAERAGRTGRISYGSRQL